MFHKRSGDDVVLITSEDGLSDIDKYDKVYLSKVFTDTIIPDDLLQIQNITYGGSGFFNEDAPFLQYEIEHMKPDYHLYDTWVYNKLSTGGKRSDYKYFLDYSIGFLTRGCFRRCGFCINKNNNKCDIHSNIAEFYDPSRPKLCFLDDNFFAYDGWKNLIEKIKLVGKPFRFMQGLDIRLLDDEKIHSMYAWRYDGNFIFSFDDINDAEIIESQIKKMYELYPKWNKHLMFYVLCGFDVNDEYNDEFWKRDIESVFKRIKILSKYSCQPYIMRFNRCYDSNYCGIYSVIASWCNQPSMFKKLSFELFAKLKGMGRYYSKYSGNLDLFIKDGNIKGAPWRYMEDLSSIMPELVEEYFRFIPSSIAVVGEDLNREIKSV